MFKRLSQFFSSKPKYPVTWSYHSEHCVTTDKGLYRFNNGGGFVDHDEIYKELRKLSSKTGRPIYIGHHPDYFCAPAPPTRECKHYKKTLKKHRAFVEDLIQRANDEELKLFNRNT